MIDERIRIISIHPAGSLI